MQLTELPAVSAPLPWQAEQWARLVQQVEEDRLPHALLLSGAEYIGKELLALALARYLLCHRPGKSANCGECAACERSARGVHGDFRWLQPEENSRVLKVDQVRSLVEFVNRTAGYGARQVVVLAPANAMNTSACNALLKSLEEPAAGTFLILVCHGLHNVPATIRSRCQMLRLPTPGSEACLDWLETAISDRQTSEGLLKLADGRPLLAQSLYRDGGVEEMQGRRVALQAMLAGKIAPTAATALWEAAAVEEALEDISGELQRLLPALSAEQLRSRAGRDAFQLLDELNGLRQAVSAGSNPNKQVFLDALLSKIQRRLGPVLRGDNIPE